MRAQRLLLLVALLVLGSQLPAAWGRRKAEKWGGCPPDDGPCLLSVPDQCVNDSQCPTHKKCCYRACFRQCLPRVLVKQGSCPEVHLRCLSPTQHLCHKDSDCSGHKRCCQGACGRDCRDPARGIGGCAPDDGPCLSVPNQCVDDSQCPFRKKCCYKLASTSASPSLG
ncbi:WAP four-disulfide core domain protein 5 [Orycteropus afer afer]|uniref:WAP four-disulfide core domain protein 5 n=1 Tax=Orycteropus afer afer TaxID=1230840 RepID=A0A8B6ZRV2_ORYAF|nr:WAP four-disulfide core domain protein 5 [Orycteropus afer afer]